PNRHVSDHAEAHRLPGGAGDPGRMPPEFLLEAATLERRGPGAGCAGREKFDSLSGAVRPAAGIRPRRDAPRAGRYTATAAFGPRGGHPPGGFGSLGRRAPT